MDKKEMNTIVEYRSLIDACVKVYEKVDSEEVKRNLQESVTKYTNELIKLDPNLRNECIKNLESIGLKSDRLAISETKPEIDDKYKECINYIEENILNSTNEELKDQYSKLMEQLNNDMENPNQELITTWIKNYKDFVVTNELDEKIMCDYLKNIFENKYKYDIEHSMIEEIYNEEKKVQTEEIDTPEVPTNIDNPTVGTNEAPSNADNTTNLPTEEAPAVITPEGNPKPTTVTNETPSQVAINVKPLKIVGVEKPLQSNLGKYGSRTMAIAFAAAVFGILPPTALSFNFFGLVGYGIYRYIKNKKYSLIDLKSVLKKNNIDIKINDTATGREYVIIDKANNQEIGIKNNQLYKKEGDKFVEITEDVEKMRYEEIKSSLLRIGAIKEEKPSLIPLAHMKSSLLKKVKGYFDVRSQKRKLIEEAKTYIDKENSKKLKARYENGKWVLKDKEGNNIELEDETLEESSEMSMGGR